MLLLDLLNARPQREARIRTRRGVDEVLDLLRAFLAEPEPGGLSRMMSHGYFSVGTLGERDFRVDYLFNSVRNPQTYAVHGWIEDTADWRLVRLRIRARSPWLGIWSLVGIVGYGVFENYAGGRIPLGAFFWIVVFVVVVFALANVLYIPGVATDRISRRIACELHGSVLENGTWIVPEDVPRN